MRESQLGTGDKKDKLEDAVLSIKDKKIISVCCADLHSVILLEDGQLLGFGYPPVVGMKTKNLRDSILQPSLLMKDNTIKTISCGHNFILVQTMNGKLFQFRSKHEKAVSKVKKNLVMKNSSIEFVQHRNFIDEWKPENHQNCSQLFKRIVLSLLLCLKAQKNQSSKVYALHHCETNS